MACTTVLVGKEASYDGSTIVARNEDSPSGIYNAKHFVVVLPKDQPRKYKSVLSHVEIELPDNPMRYTCTPNCDPSEGMWATYGVNEKNVSMTATETITTNERIMGADPLVVYQPAKDGKPEIAGGIGEEDIVTITLPYITSARHGVEFFGDLLRKYGTYEMNGIAFQDENEIWWLETIGGHNWIARRVQDDEYVVMPNQLGIDFFDWEDAKGEKKNFMCSDTLYDIVQKYHLDLRMYDDEPFNPRHAFGSHSDSDHTYNTPRAWAILRYFNPNTFAWEGLDPSFTPESDDLPWSLVPEKKITVEDVKWTLSNHYQGTPYDPYLKHGDLSAKGKYRPIGVNRTNILGLVQIRSNVPDKIKALHYLAMGSNVYNALVPFYVNINNTPEYMGAAVNTATNAHFYWANRIIAALADPHFNENIMHVERYQNKVNYKVYNMINNFDEAYIKGEYQNEDEFFENANKQISDFVQEQTDDLLNKVLYTSSNLMRNEFSRSDA